MPHLPATRHPWDIRHTSRPAPRLRPLLPSLARLASAIPAFRPGTSVPAASAPFSGGPDGTPAQRGRDRRLRRSLAASTAEGMAAEVVTACAGGSVLTGWALHLALPPVLVGLLGALPFLSQLVHLPAAWLTSALGRRRVAIAAVGLSRQVYLPLAALPFLPLDATARQLVLIAVAALAAVLAVIGNNAWVSWMGELVPVPIRGRYFGRRTALCTLGGATGTLGAGVVLDRLRAAGLEAQGLSLLAGMACAAGLASTLLMLRQHEPRADGGREPVNLSLARRPFADPRARPLLAYSIAWNASVGVAASFFAVYELRDLRMGFTLVALHGTAVATVRMLTAPFWGRVIDRAGAHRVLVLCSFAIPAIPALWLLVRPGAVLPWLAIEALLSGSLWCGHGLAAFQLPLSIAPRSGRAFYLATFSAAGGVAFALASLAGGAIAGALPHRVHVLGHEIAGMQLLFLLSAAARLGAATLTPGLLPGRTRQDGDRRAGAPALPALPRSRRAS